MSPSITSSLQTLFDHHLAAIGMTAAAATAAVTAGSFTVRWLIRTGARRNWRGEQIGTLLAASIATCVSAQGMWNFMGAAMHLTSVLRMLFFGFLEAMTISSALRARAAQSCGGTTGVDGIAMWILTGLSAVLSATEADSFGALLIRLSAPLVAAWGWERSMALGRRLRAGHRTRINWTITPQRVLVRLGLADPDPDRTASDADTQRRVIALALAVDDARAVRDAGTASTRRVRNAYRRLRRAMRHATESGGLIPFDGRDCRDVLIDHIAALRSTTALLDLDIPNPWPSTQPKHISAPTPQPTRTAENSLPEIHEGHPVSPSTDATVSGADTNVTPIRSRAHPQESARDGEDAADGCDPHRQSGGPETPVRTIAHHDKTDQAVSPMHTTDTWTGLAEKVCSEDPARRRDPDDVCKILRLWHDDRRTYPEIANLVDGYSKHAVGRVIRQARKYYSFEYADQALRATGERP